MKKISLVLYIVLLLPNLLLADAASLVYLPGATVKAMNHATVRMRDEKIEISLLKNIFKVAVSYTFENTGKKQRVLMGFPNSRGSESGTPEDINYGIKDFKAFDRDRELTIVRKESQGRETVGVVPVYETFEVNFKAGETKTIRNSYCQSYITGYGASTRRAIYILTTGASWKGNIDSIAVFIETDDPAGLLGDKTAYFLEEGTRKKIAIRDFLHAEPKPYIRAGNKIKMIFRDVDPDFDITVYVPSPLPSGVSASSELEGGKSNRYAAENLIDGNPQTAWVEGKSDNGIHETLDFSTAVFRANMAGAYKISKIGIVNGYAKNASLFLKNNRVKKIAVDVYDYLIDEKKTYNFTIEDTMEMQYLVFAAPVFVSRLKITILDVYPGTKWDDTCLSEVRMFTFEK